MDDKLVFALIMGVLAVLKHRQDKRRAVQAKADADESDRTFTVEDDDGNVLVEGEGGTFFPALAPGDVF